MQENKNIFELRLEGGGHAHIPPMEIKLKPNWKPVKRKVREYLGTQINFLGSDISQLVYDGLNNCDAQGPWLVAPYVVPKYSRSNFRTMIDLGPVNGATISEKLHIPSTKLT